MSYKLPHHRSAAKVVARQRNDIDLRAVLLFAALVIAGLLLA